jgi:hypothetical protein
MFMRTLLGGLILLLSVVPLALGATPERKERLLPVSHLPTVGDWSVAETTHFRVYHHQGREFAEKMARIAEQTRSAVIEKWFGGEDEDWARPCDLIMYDDGRQYSEATGAPPQSPAHTRIDADGGRILGRHVNLHGATAELLRSILPHEVTHAVLAGRFGRRIPRWADEGMAVLSEPADRVASHLRFLPQWRDEGLLMGARQLLELEDYPDRRAMGCFYAQSVSLVQFLSKEKTPQVFANFLRDGLRDGYATALRRHYGWDFAELDRHWLQHAFQDNGRAAAP